MIERALELAAQARLLAPPNPAVGCVLVDAQGQVIGEGHTQATGQAHGEIMALVKDMALGLGEGVFLRQSRAAQRRPDQQKTMRKVRLPALVLAGRQDPLVPLRRQEFTATLMPYGQFTIIEESGHLASLEQPEAVSDAIEAFLNGPMMLR